MNTLFGTESRKYNLTPTVKHVKQSCKVIVLISHLEYVTDYAAESAVAERVSSGLVVVVV